MSRATDSAPIWPLAGTTAMGNGLWGLSVSNGSENLIGGKSQADANVMSANLVGLNISNGNDTRVQGNYIGSDVTGAVALGNRAHGISLRGSDNTIGIGTGNEGGQSNPAGQANVIAFNGSERGPSGHGIRILAGTGNAIRGNSIFQNHGRGIDLVVRREDGTMDAFTLNDTPVLLNVDTGLSGAHDADTGPNELQNYPFFRRFDGDDQLWVLRSERNREYRIDFYSNDEPDPSGFGEGQTYLTTITAMTDAHGHAEITLPARFADQLFISATATDSADNTSEFSMVDTDGDALADRWETIGTDGMGGGIDMDEDGQLDFVLGALPAGTDPNHKDIFVEVDAMAGFAPTHGALDMVRDAFATAPANQVNNPDGTDGITLHAILDETGITNAHNGSFPGIWSDFDVVKQDHFGTTAERSAGQLTLEAKRLVYRYAIFANTFGTTFRDTHTTGISELPGNDFLITLGVVHPATASQHAGTFMHELGHTLGLHHGGGGTLVDSTGGDENLDKPNLFSVMNYVWQLPDPAYGPWSLDYSRYLFNTLDERVLRESDGIGGRDRHTTMTTDLISGVSRVVNEFGAIDWDGLDSNGDGNPVNDIVRQDINGDGAMTVLRPHRDWPEIDYYFIEYPTFEPGVHGRPVQELVLDAPDVGDSPAEIRVTLGDEEIVDNATIPIDFGSTSQNVAGPTLEFSVHNDGDQTLVIEAMTVPDGFTVVSALPTALAGVQSASFSIRLESSEAGVKIGQVSIDNNDVDENPFNFSIQGTIQVALAAGDANGDFEFNQFDIIQVLKSAKYRTGQSATFEEGDWNGDGVFDQFDVIEALQTALYLQGPYAVHTLGRIP